MLKKGVRSLANKDTNHNSYYSVSLPIVQTYNDYVTRRWLPHNNLLDDIETLLLMKYVPKHVKKKGRTQCRELPLCAGSREGCQWQALPPPVQCEETATRTRDLPVTGGKTLPLAPGPPFVPKHVLGKKNDKETQTYIA